MSEKVDAFLALRSNGRLLVGRDRIRLLEAVAEHGSITRAARAAGISYKTAWEAVDAINNLLPRPAFVTKAGGREGGGADVTAEGRRLIAVFRGLEARLNRISTAIAEDGLADVEDAVLWALGLRLSARNVFRTEVAGISRGPVDVDVTLAVSEAAAILATVTNAAADDLDLAPGRPALALVKASFVRLEAPGAGGLRQNRFPGTVKERTDAEHKSEIRIDIGASKTMVAVLPRAAAAGLGLTAGAAVVAAFDPDHVVLAVD